MRIKVKPIAVGTRVGHDGTIIHVNPDGSDIRAREPIIDSRDVGVLLEEPALIEDPGDLTKLEAQPGLGVGARLDVSRIDELAARDVGAVDKIDTDRSPEPSGLTSREAVHYDPNQRVGAAATGIVAGDPDAPPGDEDLRGARAVEENRTAAGTTVTDSSIVAGGREAVSPVHEDGSIPVDKPKRGRPAKADKDEK